MAGKVRVRGVCGGLIVLKSTFPVTAFIASWLIIGFFSSSADSLDLSSEDNMSYDKPQGGGNDYYDTY
jgi:hypothetical protein